MRKIQYKANINSIDGVHLKIALGKLTLAGDGEDQQSQETNKSRMGFAWWANPSHAPQEYFAYY